MIQQFGWNLNISRYVESVVHTALPTVDEALSNLKTALDEVYAGEDRLAGLLCEAGLMA